MGIRWALLCIGCAMALSGCSDTARVFPMDQASAQAGVPKFEFVRQGLGSVPYYRVLIPSYRVDSARGTSMRKGLFWLNDKQWAQIEPHLPTNQTGPARDDDRRIISGIIHMLQCGARWRDCPPEYGPYTTIYNRFNRWAKRGHWQTIFEALARCGKDGVTLSIDSTSIKAHRSASGGKGGSMNRRSAARAVGEPRKSTR